MELMQHPLSAAFPSMSADDFQALKDDIESNGQREPVMVFEGMVLDGWHRYRACVELSLTPLQFTFSGEDPVSFVLSHNLHRRHLSASQRAAAVVACSAWAPAGKPSAPKAAAAAALPKTTKEMAKEAKVSPRTIRDAKAAQRAGLSEPVKEGAITVEEAAKIGRGTTAVAPAAPPSTPTPAVAQVKAEDFGPSDTEMAAAQREQEEELVALRKIAESSEPLAAALDECKKLRAQVRVMQERINSLTNEKAAAIRAANSWKRKAEIAERAAA